ncbi:iron-containing redox enzyme family protein [Rathayibacter sp. YIM 133350]|uniref:iron-containing redox enzyme family protein n=1 Tax=Rathayibacter sp. YIM 133350 TaxID=3131992 RepID=UPI00307DFC83
MAIPAARGPLSRALVDVLQNGTAAEGLAGVARSVLEHTANTLDDDDVQLSLFLLYELHYGGILGVDERWEWNPSLLAARALLEDAFEADLRREVPQPHAERGVPEALAALVELDDGPSLSAFIERHATVEQLREVLVNRSIYTLKEADPHSWAIPRLHRRAKAALVEIQADEYGGGRPERLHATIFGTCLRELGLSDRYGAYVDNVRAPVFASMNMMSLFGLHRRLRGAIVGHLAAYEMTSSIPCRAYANGFRRLQLSAAASDYFDEHVEADAVHEQIAAHDLAGGLAEEEPELVDDILFGAAACLRIDGRAWGSVLESFEAGETSLRGPL